MSRLARAFARCELEQRAALVGYLTAYDPDRAGSVERVRAACAAGLDVLELGVPFSDPAADGPSVQAAMVRALAAGADLEGVLDMAAEIRTFTDVPIVLFAYANPLLQMGAARLVARACEAGVDGLLVVDLPPESAAWLREPAVDAGLDWVPLIAPTTTPARRDRILAMASGFVYVVTLKGITGVKLAEQSTDLVHQVADLRERSELPLALGFGIRTPEQVSELAKLAQGVVVGSVLVEAGQDSTQALADCVASLRRATLR